jgi:hypothetical protein
VVAVALFVITMNLVFPLRGRQVDPVSQAWEALLIIGFCLFALLIQAAMKLTTELRSDGLHVRVSMRLLESRNRGVG